MPAYIIMTRERTHDSEEMARYGDFDVLEGSGMEGAMVLRFTDMAAARAWYASPAYQEARNTAFWEQIIGYLLWMVWRRLQRRLNRAAGRAQWV